MLNQLIPLTFINLSIQAIASDLNFSLLWLGAPDNQNSHSNILSKACD